MGEFFLLVLAVFAAGLRMRSAGNRMGRFPAFPSVNPLRLQILRITATVYSQPHLPRHSLGHLQVSLYADAGHGDGARQERGTRR